MASASMEGWAAFGDFSGESVNECLFTTDRNLQTALVGRRSVFFPFFPGFLWLVFHVLS
jgi:hypothetical protein